MTPHPDANRPVLHFTPPRGWMNDPNGLFFHEGRWHLYYQHNPGDIVWGDIHWGHATSDDLLHWHHHPAAMAPSAVLGVVASGCVVVDHRNTSGLGRDGVAAVVALFSHFKPDGQQVQSAAFSLDGGQTFTDVPGNPILVDVDQPDFRDPKVFWHDATARWVMVLAVGQRVRLYTSQDLLQWDHLQTFGEGVGAHGGVWECPDLFELTGADGTRSWVLLVSVQDGGPNGGSGIQYFLGDFGEGGFVVDEPVEVPRWLDHGPDSYAGVTFAHVPASDGRRVLIAWMSNWRYPNDPPAQAWRGSMTVPRELSLEGQGPGRRVEQRMVRELMSLADRAEAQALDTFVALPSSPVLIEARLGLVGPSSAELVWLCGQEARLRLRVERETRRVVLDRSAVVPDGSPLAEPVVLPLQETLDGVVTMDVLLDRQSIEVFVRGHGAITAQLHPADELDGLQVRAGSVAGQVVPLKGS